MIINLPEYAEALENFMSPSPTLPAYPAPVATFEYMAALAEMFNSHAPVYNLSLSAISAATPQAIDYFISLIGISPETF